MRISDWSSDVCSSDLLPPSRSTRRRPAPGRNGSTGSRSSQLPCVSDADHVFAQADIGLATTKAAWRKPGRDRVAAIDGLAEHVGDKRADRQSGVKGKRVAVRGALGCRRIIKKKQKK